MKKWIRNQKSKWLNSLSQNDLTSQYFRTTLKFDSYPHDQNVCWRQKALKIGNINDIELSTVIILLGTESQKSIGLKNNEIWVLELTWGSYIYWKEWKDYSNYFIVFFLSLREEKGC